MPSSSSTKISADQLAAALESKGFKFQIKTGGASYTATLHDRATYERMKATRTNSTNSSSSTESSSSGSSSTQ